MGSRSLSYGRFLGHSFLHLARAHTKPLWDFDPTDRLACLVVSEITPFDLERSSFP